MTTKTISASINSPGRRREPIPVAPWSLAVMLLATSGLGAHAQANGDPGASEMGQAAAGHAAPKSGANAMSKGVSGGSGGGGQVKGGSNALSGSGADRPARKD